LGKAARDGGVPNVVLADIKGLVVVIFEVIE